MKIRILILMVSLLLLVTSGIRESQAATTPGSCGSWTTINPSSNIQSSPSLFTPGQPQQLTAKFTFASGPFNLGCSLNPAFGIGIAVNCISACGTSGSTPDLLGCSNCIPPGSFTNTAPASMNATGYINYVWSVMPSGTVVIGTGAYPLGAVMQVTFSLSACQLSSCNPNFLIVFAQFTSASASITACSDPLGLGWTGSTVGCFFGISNIYLLLLVGIPLVIVIPIAATMKPKRASK